MDEGNISDGSYTDTSNPYSSYSDSDEDKEDGVLDDLPTQHMDLPRPGARRKSSMFGAVGNVFRNRKPSSLSSTADYGLIAHSDHLKTEEVKSTSMLRKPSAFGLKLARKQSKLNLPKNIGDLGRRKSTMLDSGAVEMVNLSRRRDTGLPGLDHHRLDKHQLQESSQSERRLNQDAAVSTVPAEKERSKNAKRLFTRQQALTLFHVISSQQRARRKGQGKDMPAGTVEMKLLVKEMRPFLCRIPVHLARRSVDKKRALETAREVFTQQLGTKRASEDMRLLVIRQRHKMHLDLQAREEEERRLNIPPLDLDYFESERCDCDSCFPNDVFSSPVFSPMCVFTVMLVSGGTVIAMRANGVNVSHLLPQDLQELTKITRGCRRFALKQKPSVRRYLYV
jgi:hypothetical protein